MAELSLQLSGMASRHRLSHRGYPQGSIHVDDRQRRSDYPDDQADFAPGWRRQRVWLWIDVEIGVGTATRINSAPIDAPDLQDGGSTWSNELWYSIGPQEKCGSVARSSADWVGDVRLVFRVSISDPVPLSLIGAYMEAQ